MLTFGIWRKTIPQSKPCVFSSSANACGYVCTHVASTSKSHGRHAKCERALMSPEERARTQTREAISETKELQRSRTEYASLFFYMFDGHSPHSQFNRPYFRVSSCSLSRDLLFRCADKRSTIDSIPFNS